MSMHTTTDIYAREGAGVTGETSLASLSWGAIIAGAFAACALSIFLLALGAGLGFSVVSPTPRQGVSAHTAAIVVGNNMNGWISWKDKDGKTLDAVVRQAS